MDTKQKKRVIILGSGPGWDTCPYNSEVWAVGKMLMLNPSPKKVDRLFNMDDIDHLLMIRRGVFSRDAYIKAINERRVPFYSVRTYEDIPQSVEYPLREVVEKVKVPYFENSIAYMIALAIVEGYEQIDLYGVAQMGAHEYVKERGCVEYWLGVAAGLGLAVGIHTHSLLLRGTSEYMYGYMQTREELKAEGKLP